MTLLCGDVLQVLRTLPVASVQCCVTSPPYWGLRDYGTGEWRGGDPKCEHKGAPLCSSSSLAGYTSDSVKLRTYTMPIKNLCPHCGARRIDKQLGLERTPDEYVAKMVEVFREVRRVLRDDGTLWLNMGDSYAREGGKTPGVPRHWDGRGPDAGGQHDKRSLASEIGLKPKDLVGIPWMLAFALRADGWYLRQDIIWAKPNPMPESVTDRCTKSHEYLFLLTKSQRYYFDHEALKEPCSSKTPQSRQPNKSTAHRDGPREGGNSGLNALAARMLNGSATTRNRRDVWNIATQPYKEAHFAVFPTTLVEPCLLAGVPARCCTACGAPYANSVHHTKAVIQKSQRAHSMGLEGCTQQVAAHSEVTYSTTPTCRCTAAPSTHPTVLDPFCGSGTVGVVCKQFGLNFIGIELNRKYVQMARRRIKATQRRTQ